MNNQKENRKMLNFGMNYYDSTFNEEKVTLKEFIAVMLIAIGFSILFASVFIYLIPAVGMFFVRA